MSLPNIYLGGTEMFEFINLYFLRCHQLFIYSSWLLYNLYPTAILDKVAFTKQVLSEKPLYITCYRSNSKYTDIISSFNKGLKERQDNGKLAALFKELGI
jgi:hypothetical protein